MFLLSLLFVLMSFSLMYMQVISNSVKVAECLPFGKQLLYYVNRMFPL